MFNHTKTPIKVGPAYKTKLAEQLRQDLQSHCNRVQNSLGEAFEAQACSNEKRRDDFGKNYCAARAELDAVFFDLASSILELDKAQFEFESKRRSTELQEAKKAYQGAVTEWNAVSPIQNKRTHAAAEHRVKLENIKSSKTMSQDTKSFKIRKLEIEYCEALEKHEASEQGSELEDWLERYKDHIARTTEFSVLNDKYHQCEKPATKILNYIEDKLTEKFDEEKGYFSKPDHFFASERKIRFDDSLTQELDESLVRSFQAL